VSCAVPAPPGLDGEIGRDQLQSAIESSSDEISVASFDHDAFYQRIWGSSLVQSGMFRNSRSEELLVLTSPSWPRALIISLESSTTDPHGTHPSLRAPSANRQSTVARLYGEAKAPLYGGDDSLVCRLQQGEGLRALQAKLDARPKRSVALAEGPPNEAAASSAGSAPDGGKEKEGNAGKEEVKPARSKPTGPLKQLSLKPFAAKKVEPEPAGDATPPAAPAVSRPRQPPSAGQLSAPKAPSAKPCPPPSGTPSLPATAPRPLGAAAQKRKSIPAMTTPAQNGGFAGGLEIEVHDKKVAAGVILADERAQDKRRKLVAKDERQRLGDESHPGKRGGGVPRMMPMHDHMPYPLMLIAAHWRCSKQGCLACARPHMPSPCLPMATHAIPFTTTSDRLRVCILFVLWQASSPVPSMSPSVALVMEAGTVAFMATA